VSAGEVPLVLKLSGKIDIPHEASLRFVGQLREILAKYPS
jgi:hypothetical protein